MHEQKDGRFYVGLAPTAGRVSGTMLVALSEVMERFGVTGARLTPYQKIVLIGVDGDDVPALLDALDGIGLSGRPSQWRRNTMACTGIEFCKLAIVDTKNRARDLVAELERRFPDLDVPITVNVNGCPNACARTQVADIGLKGQLVMDGGEQVEGFQVHLGGATGLQANFGRKLRAHKVTSRGPRRLRDRRRLELPGRARGRRELRVVGGPRRRGAAPRREGPGAFMSSRGIPFHCPYCGETDLWPHEPTEGAGHGAWECRGCLRAFQLKMLGLVRPTGSTGAPS